MHVELVENVKDFDENLDKNKVIIISRANIHCDICDSAVEFEIIKNDEVKLNEYITRIAHTKLPKSITFLNWFDYKNEIMSGNLENLCCYYDCKRDILCFIPYIIIRKVEELPFVEAFLNGEAKSDKKMGIGIDFDVMPDFIINFNNKDIQCRMMFTSISPMSSRIYATSDINTYNYGFDNDKIDILCDKYKLNEDAKLEKIKKIHERTKQLNDNKPLKIKGIPLSYICKGINTNKIN